MKAFSKKLRGYYAQEGFKPLNFERPAISYLSIARNILFENSKSGLIWSEGFIASVLQIFKADEICMKKIFAKHISSKSNLEDLTKLSNDTQMDLYEGSPRLFN